MTTATHRANALNRPEVMVARHIKIHSVGYAPGTYYVFEQVYDKNGNPMEGVYVDRNGDGEVTEKDLYQYHKPTADVIMGFNSKVSYKNWDFGFNGRASIGNYNYNGIAANAAIGTSAIFSNSALSNQPKAAFNTNFKKDSASRIITSKTLLFEDR